MTTTKTEYWLSIGIMHRSGKIAYAGNFDEVVTVFLSGLSHNDRHGYEAGLKMHKLIIEPMFTAGDDEGEGSAMDLFESFQGEYGHTMYSLDPDDFNRIYMKFDDYVLREEIDDYLTKIWPAVSTIHVTEKIGDSDDNGVRIYDFTVVEKQITTVKHKFIPKETK